MPFGSSMIATGGPPAAQLLEAAYTPRRFASALGAHSGSGVARLFPCQMQQFGRCRRSNSAWRGCCVGVRCR